MVKLLVLYRNVHNICLYNNNVLHCHDSVLSSSLCELPVSIDGQSESRPFLDRFFKNLSFKIAMSRRAGVVLSEVYFLVNLFMPRHTVAGYYGFTLDVRVSIRQSYIHPSDHISFPSMDFHQTWYVH